MQSVTPFTGRSGCLRWSRRALTCARPRRCVTVGPADTPFKTVVWYWCVYLLNVIITHLSLTQPSTTPPSPPIFLNFYLFLPSFIPAFISHALAVSPPSPPPAASPSNFVSPIPRLTSLPFYSDHSRSFRQPSTLQPLDQGREALIAVWCAHTGLHAMRISSVRHIMNGRGSSWCIANTSRKWKYITVTIEAASRGRRAVCVCLRVCVFNVSHWLLSQQSDSWVMKSQ